MKSRFMLYIALALLTIFSVVALIHNAEGIWNDLNNRDHYVLASSAKIVKEECTNWNYAMFNTCKLHISAPHFSKVLYEKRFGRLTAKDVKLLQDQNNPEHFTTDLGLDTLTNRIIYFLIMNVLVTFLFIVGGVILIKRRIMLMRSVRETA